MTGLTVSYSQLCDMLDDARQSYDAARESDARQDFEFEGNGALRSFATCFGLRNSAEYTNAFWGAKRLLGRPDDDRMATGAIVIELCRSVLGYDIVNGVGL